MKNLFQAIFLCLFITGCCDGGLRDTTHFVKGKVENAITKEPMKNIEVNVKDLNCFGHSTDCKGLDFSVFTGDEGEFEYDFDWCCNALNLFLLSDSIKDIQGKCFRWEYEDLNDNDLNLYRCYSASDLGTERGIYYDFVVLFQPELYISLIGNSNSKLELVDIKFDQLDVELNSKGNGGLIKDISEFKGELELQLIYSNDSIVTRFIEYDYFEKCSIRIEFEI